jgi:hypothetical protein
MVPGFYFKTFQYIVKKQKYQTKFQKTNEQIKQSCASKMTPANIFFLSLYLSSFFSVLHANMLDKITYNLPTLHHEILSHTVL